MTGVDDCRKHNKLTGRLDPRVGMREIG